MQIEQLVSMANDIAAFFRATPDANEAVRGIANHLKLYWDPRMRKQLLAHVEGGGEGLSQLAKAGVEMLKSG